MFSLQISATLSKKNVRYNAIPFKRINFNETHMRPTSSSFENIARDGILCYTRQNLTTPGENKEAQWHY